MSNETVNIRKAVAEDTAAIAHLHVESWRTTYRDLIPTHLLDQLDVAQREQMWHGAITHPNSTTVLHVAEVAGAIVGFVACGREQGEHKAYDGELYALYLLEPFQRKGLGRMLFQTAVNQLRTAGYGSMLLWVLEGNPAIRFYEAMGGVLLGTRTELLDNVTLQERGYGWKL